MDANSAMKECAKYSIRAIALHVHQKGKRKAALPTLEENANLNARKIHHRSLLHPDLPHYYSVTITHFFYFLLVMAILIPAISLYFLCAFRFEFRKLINKQKVTCTCKIFILNFDRAHEITAYDYKQDRRSL